MTARVVSNLQFEGGAKVTGLPSPIDPTDAVNKQYADSLAGGSVVVTTVEIDVGPSPVKEATFTIMDVSITPTTKILVFQAGRAATGRSADENEWTRLHLVANPASGQFELWVMCLNGSMTGTFLIDYIKG